MPASMALRTGVSGGTTCLTVPRTAAAQPALPESVYGGHEEKRGELRKTFLNAPPLYFDRNAICLHKNATVWHYLSSLFYLYVVENLLQAFLLSPTYMKREDRMVAQNTPAVPVRRAGDFWLYWAGQTISLIAGTCESRMQQTGSGEHS